jgi:hypothetical protein
MLNLIQCDDFIPNAYEIREQVIQREFKTEKGPDGANYSNVQLVEVPELIDRISLVLGGKIIPRLSGFRLNLAGELPHSWVHSDEICAGWASVLYLNPPSQCQGGTAFWKHRGLNIDHSPTPEAITSNGFDVEWFQQMLSREWKELDYWEQAGFVTMKFNRFITYPTSMFHSRYPFEGFGTSPADGRLVWVCFYDYV